MEHKRAVIEGVQWIVQALYLKTNNTYGHCILLSGGFGQ